MRVRTAFLGGCLAVLAGLYPGLAQELPPGTFPPLPPSPQPAARLRTNSTVFPATPVAPGTFAQPRLPAGISATDALSFDAKEKVVNVKTGEAEAKFTFAVTNISKEVVTVLSVHTSCGCTAARLPSTPWVLNPGEGGEIGATMNLAGKFGTVTKTVTVVSSSGSVPLLVKAILPQEAFTNMQRMTDRSRALQVAAADRQAVFRGDCASCHVAKSVGKKGHDLYVESCGICHDAEHRATMVPALRGRPARAGVAFDHAYWDQWVRNGKEGSLMPAFDSKKGGPLTEEQIDSLTEYLADKFMLEPAPVAVPVVVPGGLPNQLSTPTIVRPNPALRPQTVVRPTLPPPGLGPTPPL